ncbi:dephospho-CoA kinase [Paenibacillus sp. JX-17]|uniref:Dephospho-CoA kinase n=1 Tax=Paenibacillus lacisoli TaxID=3064525 RepID=A0ABT9CA09_9BACL|nr:dephospho-CoA kinase [Paenibacillus sp. JX-17]MDO7906093.1 dephospho-CoA kinase [Paenibacillus sp. JX-17]
MNIGLTGGIATGKSTVSSLLVRMGALLIDADVIAREVMLPGHPVLQQVVQHFGQAVLLEDGTLNRKKLGEIVFQDPGAREVLNGLTHPAIRQEMWDRMARYEVDHPQKLVVVDIPLLYESGLESQFEEVLLVYVPRELQLQRLMNRDQITEEQAQARLNAQMDIEQKKSRADIIIDNSRDLDLTQRQLEAFWKRKVRS